MNWEVVFTQEEESTRLTVNSRLHCKRIGIQKYKAKKFIALYFYSDNLIFAAFLVRLT